MFSVQVCLQKCSPREESAAGVARSEKQVQWGARVVIYSLSRILGRMSAAGRGALRFKSRWRGRQRQRVDNVRINLPRGSLSLSNTNSLVFV